MKREDIIRMAREAQSVYASETWTFSLSANQLEHFTKFVAAAERTECAKVSETLGVHPTLNVYNGGPEWYKHGKEIAQAIRARGEK